MLSVVYQQRNFLSPQRIRFLLVDASPQLGYEFLCTIEDAFDIPTHHVVQLWQTAAELNLEDGFTTGHELMSSTGSGRSGLVKKSLNITNLITMKSGTDPRFHTIRCQYRGVLSDQGTERGHSNISLDIIPRYRGHASPSDTASFAYPHCLQMPGLLHMLYDALENCCKKNALYKKFLDHLRIYLSFMTDSILIRKFKSVCFDSAAESAGIQKHAAQHCDWKWEFLSDALDKSMPQYPLVKRRFDVDKLLSSDSGTKLSNMTVRLMADVLEQDILPPVAEAYRIKGKSIERTAKKLSMCDCHQHLYVHGRGRKRRLKMMKEQTGVEHCCWESRRLPWFVAEGKAEMLQDIHNDSSDTLQSMLAEASPARRAELVSGIDQLTLDLNEELVSKLDFVDHAPYAGIGAFFSEQGGSLAQARALASRCIDEVDKAEREGHLSKVHRVARRLFERGTLVRADLDQFVASNLPLRSFARAYTGILEYALMPVLERRIEEIHARIKRIGRSCFGVGLPTVCAMIRLPMHLAALEQNRDFREFVLSNWRSRRIADQLLSLRYPPNFLKSKSLKQKIEIVYQCSAEQEFLDTSASRVAHAVLLGRPFHIPRHPPSLHPRSRIPMPSHPSFEV